MPINLRVPSRRSDAAAATEINGHDDQNAKRDETSSSSDEEEYELQDLRDRLKSSRGSRFDLIANEFGASAATAAGTARRFSRENVINGIRDLSKDFVIHPDNRFRSSFLYTCLCDIILLWFFFW